MKCRRRSLYERFLWFHKQVKAEKYPNARVLAEKFEISPKTAQRDIEFIRDRLYAPLVYMPDRRGYAYEEKTYELPAIWITEEELAALFIASRLASTIPDRSLKSSFKSFLEQIVSFCTLDTPFSLDELSERISVKNIEYARVGEATFQKVVNAVFYQKALEISYYSPRKDEVTKRIIFPLHLLQYMGSWHVISHCSLRNELRDFALSRIPMRMYRTSVGGSMPEDQMVLAYMQRAGRTVTPLNSMVKCKLIPEQLRQANCSA